MRSPSSGYNTSLHHSFSDLDNTSNARKCRTNSIERGALKANCRTQCVNVCVWRQVGGVDVSDFTHEEAVEAIRRAGNSVELLVQSPRVTHLHTHNNTHAQRHNIHKI